MKGFDISPEICLPLLSFEQLLKEKEEGKRVFGTNLGKYHDLVLVTLSRVTDYLLKASVVNLRISP